MSDTYTFNLAKDAWICFHCGERFSVAAQGCYENARKAAAEHFGADIDEEPLCQIAQHPQAELVERLVAAERLMREAWADRDTAEEEAAGAVGELRSIASMFKGAKTVYDAWCMYDSMEGRALAAEAILTEIAKAHPKLVEAAREEVCKPKEPA